MSKAKEYINKLYKLERTGIKYDLSNITALCKKLGNPQNKFKSIHIAGTNGKGGTASLIASILIESGYKTALFTSPHLLTFNERIQINGKKISDEYIIRFVERYLNIFRKYKPSFFELITSMAFKYFADKKVDYAVIEAGLGGRLDSTNIITPLLSVITHIGIDHTEFLGKDIKKIAGEKAGIIKDKVDVIISDEHQYLKSVFNKHIKNNKIFYSAESTNIIKFGNNYKLTIKDTLQKSFNITFNTDLNGKYQLNNISTAVFCIYLLSKKGELTFNKRFVYRGIKKVRDNTHYRGRFQQIQLKNRTYILDVSHNTDGIQVLTNHLIEQKIKPITIFSCIISKDHKKMINELIKGTDIVIFTKMSYLKGTDPIKLFSYAKKLGLNSKEFYYACNLNDALKISDIINISRSKILITGSFFIVFDAINELSLNKYFS